MKKTTSSYKGVSRRYGKWWARIQVNGHEYGIGQYDTEKEAAKAYDLEVLKKNLDRPTNFYYKKLA